MPILDPSLQCFLVQNITETEGKDGYAFILKYLKIASRNIFRNLNTIETSIKFKKDFELSILSINKLFKCDFKAHELGKSYQRNCYKYFFKHINYINKEEESKKYRGIYRICNDKFNTIFFQPCVFYSKYHSWFFTDTPIAILAIDSEKFISIPMAKTKIMQIIKIEIDLLSASGLTLVLCFNYTPDTIDFFKQIIQDDQFSEIHCNIFKDSNIKSFLQNFQNISHFFRGYFYLYCHFTEKKSEEQLLMKELKKNPRTFILTFSMSPQKVLTKLEFIQTKPFSHCKSGFKYDHLRIFLSYVPLYDSESIDESFIPSVVSSLCLGYISPSDFLRMSSKRVKILFDDDMNRHHHTIKYVSSENIHSVRSDLFVEDALLLTKMEKEEIQTINKIKTRVDMKIMNDKKFHKKYLFKLLKDKKYKECLQYVTFAYSHYIRSSIPDFMIHKAQIYAAFEACKTCFHAVKNKNEDGPKGVIYQVDTGEGKSCIICLIAAVLALKKYTVHIASSNIKLSNRDYYCSYEFFKLLGLKSAVLLHKNELPFQTKLHEEDDQQDQIPLKDLYHIEEDSYFKSNADYYYKINTMKSNEEYKKNYPKEFFGDDLFKNPSKMNFPICGISNNNLETKTKAKIIFSTFVNFECFYLHLMEMCPGYIDRYFKKCSLLVDEADSILIDEIQNGTIVAREIKSNAKEILSLVYSNKMNKKSAKETFLELNKNPMCSDIKLSDVKQMYKEIKLINKKEYSEGQKYILKTFEVRNNHRIRNLIRKTIQSAFSIKDRIEDFANKQIFKIEDNDDEDDGNEEEEDSEFDTTEVRKFRQVVPYDYDHKGILEENKEFSGFVQQFISLKECLKDENKDIVFKDISMNYLYVSHPIFANLYHKICGFTGTVGNADDKKIYYDHYRLISKKVPRHKPNLRVNFPMILCETIDERNEKIVSEVIYFHEKGLPVLVIFQDLNEISKVQENLYEKGIRYINIFNGIDEHVLPERIAGIKGAVSLGSNVCGRGTDIQCGDFPLHVIVSYHSSNIRVMNQAYGRTARQGKNGTCRCICLKEQIFRKSGSLNNEKIQKAIEDFDYKIIEQKKFIESFKETRPWIFNFNIKKQKIPTEDIIELRRAKINVNRIVAYKYRFPICMSISTFLKIQSQKIFSLFNCPNCKYTWRLFQRHVREMILESWSLMIRKVEKLCSNKKKKRNFKETLNKQIDILHKKLGKYLPADSNFDIIPTFMYIHQKVLKKYQNKIVNSFSKLGKVYFKFFETNFTLFQLGFKPYSLLSRSGARISYKNIGDTNYIEDPELKFEKKMPDNKFTLLSITERIDKLFNMIFQKISCTLGEKVYLKFFLRRTLAGCEFGVCFDLSLNNIKKEITEEKYCLVDKDPLLVFTIFLWSTWPIMAGILIFVLVYVVGLTGKIMSWIQAFPAQISKEVIKQGAIAAINLIIPNTADFFLGKIVDFLEGVLDKQIEKLNETEKLVVNELKKFLFTKSFEKSGEFISNKISSILGGFVKLPSKLSEVIEKSVNVEILMKIGLLLLLCLGSYIRGVMNRKDAIEHSEANAKIYDSAFDDREETKTNIEPSKKLDDILDKEEIYEKIDEIPNLQKEKNEELVTSYEKQSKTYLFKFKTLNLSKYEVKPSDFKVYQKAKTDFGNYHSQIVIHRISQKYCLKLQFSMKKINFIEIARLYATNSHPALSHFNGYYTKSPHFYIFVENKENGFLKDYIKDHKFNSTEKLIISYGIACVLEFLHNRKIILRTLYPNNILLDSQLYPYLYDFDIATNIENPKDEEHEITSSIPLIMSPEFILDPLNYSNTLPIDVYSYAITLFYFVVNPDDPFYSSGGIQLINMVIKGERPSFLDSTPLAWKNLIENCWQNDPSKRPTFSEICDHLESEAFVNSSINRVAFNDYMKIMKQFRPT